ncbi:sugar-transfer associated ATP-grasp domain-containing protein [Salinarimonas ramus]|uniref:Alpha-L-glutamate ligase-related protein ATP-grasp domain-containing protein n=1 Tax=Salinarimonas ramus TaxID=690164 RepID=A0A917QGP7_9HYPH|nr:sugar-transfer associated ATP-grasp domain-containing protein [Salinarimonas ramus]GGK48987.1 hypothetical protein GCM10011322_39990 [Salinarimonas ramus]
MIGGVVRRLRVVRRLLEIERGAGGKRRPDLWARGFVSQRAALYPLDRHPRALFLSDWEIEHRLARANPDSAIAFLENKAFFHAFLAWSGLADHAAEMIGILADGVPTLAAGRTDLESAFAEGRLVCKPVSGAGGRDVVVATSPGDLPRDRGPYVVERFIPQHAYVAEIFPSSLNTIRILTLRGASGEPFAAAAVHRFGVAASAPVDNFKRGGLSALVGLETGRLSAARSNPGLHARDVHSHHPDTGAPIDGVVVPGWEAARGLALDLAARIPGLRLAGWDVCVSRDGPRVVEGNARIPNPNLIQAHGPLLGDPRIRDALWRMGVLSDRRRREAEKASRG